MSELTKALKGTPQYEEWLRKFREKKGGKKQEEEKPVYQKYDKEHLLNNPPDFAKNKEIWEKSVNKLTKDGKKVSYAAAVFLYKKKLEKSLLEKAYISDKEREALADKGKAMPDGSFPVRNKQDLKNAVRAIGRAKNPEEVKQFVIKRAKQLKCLSLIPETWKK